MTLQEYILNFRKEHGLSQRQFAQMADISAGYVSMIENNLNPKTGKPPVLKISTVRKLAIAMGTSAHKLADSVEDATWSSVEDDEALLTEDERHLVMFYREMTLSEKNLLMALAHAITKQ